MYSPRWATVPPSLTFTRTGGWSGGGASGAVVAAEAVDSTGAWDTGGAVGTGAQANSRAIPVVSRMCARYDCFIAMPSSVQHRQPAARSAPTLARLVTASVGMRDAGPSAVPGKPGPLRLLDRREVERSPGGIREVLVEPQNVGCDPVGLAPARIGPQVDLQHRLLRGHARVIEPARLVAEQLEVAAQEREVRERPHGPVARHDPLHVERGD